MITVSYMYPNREDGRFDLAYYCTKHIPLVQKIFGETLKRVQVEQAIQANHIRTESSFLLVTHLYFDSVDDLQEIFEKNKRVLMVDMLKFTDIQPVVQVSNVIIDYTAEAEADFPLPDFPDSARDGFPENAPLFKQRNSSVEKR